MAICEKEENSWAELYDDILELITDKIDQVCDYVRFGAVCKSWLSFCKRRYKHKHQLHTNQHFPLLLIPTLDANQQTRTLCNIIHGKVYDKIQLDFPYKRCVGSSHGWLIFMENNLTLELILVNPFVGENGSMIIKLPPIEPDFGVVYSMDTYGVMKVILSKDPYTSPNDYEVMAIYTGIRNLAHYRSGDLFWSFPYPRHKKCVSFSDIIFFKGNIYAVDLYNWIVKITLKFKKKNPACNDNCSPYYLQFKTISKRLKLGSYNLLSGNAYLVETSKGDLLLVRRYYMFFRKFAKQKRMHAMKVGNQELITYEFEQNEDGDNEDRDPESSVYFGIYKLNFPSGRRKLKMETLHGEILFLGDNYSISIPASKCPSGLLPNSIYYTDDNFDHLYEENGEMRSWDIGVFKLENKTCEEYFLPSFPTKLDMRPIFTVPRYNFKIVS